MKNKLNQKLRINNLEGHCLERCTQTSKNLVLCKKKLILYEKQKHN